MGKNEIITQLAKDKAFETIIANVAKHSLDNNMQDLAQDLYLDLMGKPDKLIEGLYEAKQLNFFLARMVINNLKSLNSRYYKDYIKYDSNKNNLDGIDLADE